MRNKMKLKTLSNITAIATLIGIVILFIFNMVNGFCWDWIDYIVCGWCLVWSILILKQSTEYWDD